MKAYFAADVLRELDNAHIPEFKEALYHAREASTVKEQALAVSNLILRAWWPSGNFEDATKNPVSSFPLDYSPRYRWSVPMPMGKLNLRNTFGVGAPAFGPRLPRLETLAISGWFVRYDTVNDDISAKVWHSGQPVRNLNVAGKEHVTDVDVFHALNRIVMNLKAESNPIRNYQLVDPSLEINDAILNDPLRKPLPAIPSMAQLLLGHI